MESKPRLTGAVMRSLVELRRVGLRVMRRDVQRLWEGVEEVRVAPAIKWILAMEAWRESKAVERDARRAEKLQRPPAGSVSAGS